MLKIYGTWVECGVLGVQIRSNQNSYCQRNDLINCEWCLLPQRKLRPKPFHRTLHPPVNTREWRPLHFEPTRRERMLSLVAATFLVFSAPAVPSILVADGLAPSAMKLLQQSGAKIVDRHLSNAELSGGGLQDFDAVIVRSATMLSAAAIKDGAAGRLRVIGRAGVGVDNIDVAAALEYGCWVVNTPGASTASVVELTLAHMLAAARGLQVADQGLKTGRWLKGKIKLGVDDGPRVGHELRGKRLGLLGFGRIAQGVARAASALGMVVHAYSRHAQPEVAASHGVILEPSEADLFAKCARSRRRLRH
jgi:hypothetical protein